MITPVGSRLAQQLRRRYLCGACWSQLNLFFAPDRLYLVKCVSCGDATPGYVSARYVEHFKAENHAQYLEARAALADVLPWLKIERHSVQDNLSALGF